MPGRKRNRHLCDSSSSQHEVGGCSSADQINKVVLMQKTLISGYDLRKWPKSSRQKLRPTVKIILEVDCAEKTHKIPVPKLALIAASPNFQTHMVNDPRATNIGLIHKAISLEAVKIIAKWLEDVCNMTQVPCIPVPTELSDALKLRLTAHKLGMHQYVEHVEQRYIKNITDRVPGICEIVLVVENTCDKPEDRAIIVALANRLSYLCRCHKVPEKQENAYTRLLAVKKYGKLLTSVREDEVRAMIEREQDGV